MPRQPGDQSEHQSRHPGRVGVVGAGRLGGQDSLHGPVVRGVVDLLQCREREQFAVVLLALGETLSVEDLLFSRESPLHVLVMSGLAGGERSVVGSVARVHDHDLHIQLPHFRPHHLRQSQQSGLNIVMSDKVEEVEVLSTDLASCVGPQCR